MGAAELSGMGDSSNMGDMDAADIGDMGAAEMCAAGRWCPMRVLKSYWEVKILCKMGQIRRCDPVSRTWGQQSQDLGKVSVQVVRYFLELHDKAQYGGDEYLINFGVVKHPKGQRTPIQGSLVILL